MAYKFHHGTDSCTRFLLVSCNCLASKQTTLFSRIPVELDWSIQGCETRLSKHAKRLENTDCARTIIIGAGRRQEREQVVHGVLVSADDCEGRRKVLNLGFKASDDGGLWEGVGEELEGDVGVEGGIQDDLGDMIMEPQSTLFTIGTAKVAGIVTGHMLENIMHILGRNLAEQGLHISLMRQVGKI